MLYDRDVLEVMYPRWSTNYNLLEIETEMWRRFTINSIYYFKSKGTRKAIESLLGLLGIPDNMLTLNEYVYTTTPIDYNVAFNYLVLLEGAETTGTTSASTWTYDIQYSGTYINNVQNQITNSLIPLVSIPTYANIFSMSGLTGFPISPVQSDTMFFQNNGGWFENDPLFLSPDQFDSGKQWLDFYRTLGNTHEDNFLLNIVYSGTQIGTVQIPKNIGFTLKKEVDNVKCWIEDINVSGWTNQYGVFPRKCDYIPGRETDYIGKTGLVINTKEVDMFLDFSKLQFVSGACVNMTGSTTMPTGYAAGPTYSHLIQYVDKLDKFWIDIVKQMVPATTIFRIGVVYANCETGTDQYYFYNLPSTSDNLHYLNPYFALSGDQFTVISGYTLPFSGYSWTESDWLKYQSEINPNADPYNRFNMQPIFNAIQSLPPPNNYPGLIYFPPEFIGDPAILGAF